MQNIGTGLQQSSHSYPSSEAQAQFLHKLQRLFAEGSFASTYKFALLIALADLAAEHGADSSEALLLTTRQIAMCFIHLYWQQALPYDSGHTGTEAGGLWQNNGSQAIVGSAIANFRAQTQIPTFLAATAHPRFQPLLAPVAAVVSAQPLKFMQNFGGFTDEFLYERLGSSNIKLKPGVAYCLRHFYPLVQQLARSHWIRHIRANRRNGAI